MRRERMCFGAITAEGKEGTRMIRSFIVGAIAGGVAVWLWRDQMQEYLDRKTRTVRVRTADGLEAVEHTAEGLLDRAAKPLRRAEELLDEKEARIGADLRAGQKAIRPTSAGDGRD